MRYILRMTKPENKTTRADVLIELINPTCRQLSDKLSELLRSGVVSCTITKEDGTLRFYANDLCMVFAAYLKEVA